MPAIVAVACDNNEVSPHFGRCERYLIARVDGPDVQLVKWLQNPGHAPGVLPALMQQEGVQCVICGGAGPRAVGLLAQAGIDLIPGVSGDPLIALQALAHGTLHAGESMCEH